MFVPIQSWMQTDWNILTKSVLVRFPDCFAKPKAHENAVKHEIGKVLVAYLRCRHDSNNLFFVIFALSLSDAAQSWNMQSSASFLQGTTLSSSTIATLLTFCDSSFLLCLLPQLGKKTLLVNVSVSSLRKFLAKGRRRSSLPALYHWNKGLLRTQSCSCLPVFCCHRLFYNESWVSTILSLA